MGFFEFITRALALSPFVFLRYLPALITFGLILVGIILSTDNIWVIGLVGFIMGTFGTAFLVVWGIRGGLGAIGATAAGTADGYMSVVPRTLFVHLLLQLIFAVAISAVAYFVVSTFVLPVVAPGVVENYWAVLTALQSGEQSQIDGIAPLIAGFEADPGPLRLTLAILNGGLYLVFGICVGVFGVPMAALSANAVQYSPQNDMIFGLARYFPHQFTLYLIAFALPVTLIALFGPIGLQFDAFTGGLSQPILAGVLGVYFLFAPCISYAGMALGYQQVREKVADERRAQSTPVIDRDAERKNLASLRKVRTEGRTGAKVYDPVAEARMRRRGE